MSKKEITSKYLKALYKNNIVRVPDGSCQRLFNLMEPEFYHAGIYGWDYDVYSIGGYAIITGYRAFKCRMIDYDVCKAYDTEAAQILHDSITTEEAKGKLDKLIWKFMEEVVKQ